MGCLAGKAVIVTGAGQGLGQAYARHAAAEGAAVVVNDVDADSAEAVARSIREVGQRAIGFPADVSSWPEAQRMVERCVAEFGAVDGLVNNAARLYTARPEEETEEALRTIVETNICGAMFCGVHASRQMLAQGRGAIVNVTSGAQSGIPGLGAYGATKGAIASLTYAWALDLGPRGIRVNAVSPLARSRMSELGRQESIARGESPRPQPTGMPADIAPLVTFLLSELSADIQGQVVRLDGRKLSLVTHPMVLEPSVERDAWTVASVQEAFETQLRAHRLPCGVRMAVVEIRN